MDPILLLVLVIFALLVLFAVGSRMYRNGGSSGETRPAEQTFEFDPDTENVTPTVRRKTRLIAPAQFAAAPNRKLAVQALPFTDTSQAIPPPGKGIDAILVTVLNPSVRYTDSDAEIYEFDPPLTLVVNYQPEDEAATTMNGTVPQLSLATVYHDDTGWKFERLPTTISPSGKGNGTLTASVTTLHPADPFVVCRP